MANGEWEIEVGKGLRLKAVEQEGRNMVFTVTCRGNGGSRETVEIEAADRGGLFAELKRRGITPISVSEGKARRARRGASTMNGQGAGSPGQRAGFPSKWVVAAVIALIAAAVGVWWLWVAKDAVIYPNNYLGAPCIIGHETEVRPGAFIRGSALVGDHCVVGNSTELKNVILFDNVQVPHYNYIGDSILGYRSHMGAGSITWLSYSIRN